MPNPMRSMKTVKKTTSSDGLRVMRVQNVEHEAQDSRRANQLLPERQTRAEHRREDQRVKVGSVRCSGRAECQRTTEMAFAPCATIKSVRRARTGHRSALFLPVAGRIVNPYPRDLTRQVMSDKTETHKEHPRSSRDRYRRFVQD